MPLPHFTRVCPNWRTLVCFGRAVSPIVALSPGQRPGVSMPRTIHLAFLRMQKCHAPKARNPKTRHGALPLIKQAALSERDTFINATSSPQGVALGYGQQLGFQPAPNQLTTLIARFFMCSIQPSFSPRYFLFSSRNFFLSALYFSLSAQKKFVTKFVTCITKFLTCVTKFVTLVTNFVTKNFLYDNENFQGEREK